MPGFPVLTTLQPIFGFDMHKSIPPPPPAGPLLVSHPVVWGVGLSQKSRLMWAVGTSKACSPESRCPKPIAVGAGHACGRTHDAGPHLGHAWPNLLMPLVVIGSASKAEFGSGTVKVGTANGPKDMAVNAAYAMNFNLNCQEFPLPPLPSGMALTVNYNVTAGFGLMDFVRGLTQMGLDMAITWAVSALCASLTGAVKGIWARAADRSIWAAMWKGVKGSFSFASDKGLTSAKDLFTDGAGYFASNGRLFVNSWRALGKAAQYMWKNDPPGQTLNVVGNALSTFGVGTPTGYSPQYTPVGGGEHVNHWVDRLFR
jgi:hypothetical protein